MLQSEPSADPLGKKPSMLSRLAIPLVLAGPLTAATVLNGTLEVIDGPEDLNPAPILTAGSLYDGGSGSSSDGVRVVNGIDFGDSYTPVNPSFTGGIVGGSTNGSGASAPSLGDTALNEVLRTQGYAPTLDIDFNLTPGTYIIQLLFWEPWFGWGGGGGIGSRVMAIAMEGETLVSDLDLVEEHGLSTTTQAVLYTHTLEVTDGTLDLTISSSVDNATLAGIIISPLDGVTANVPGPPEVVGADDFATADGNLGGSLGGSWFDFDNTSADDPEAGHEGGTAPWQNFAGAPTIAGGKALTDNSSALRTFNGFSEARGAFSAAVDIIHKQVYFKATLMRDTDTTWSGISAYDFGTERILFGVPGAPNPGSGELEFGIHVLNSGALDGHSYSGVEPVVGETVTVVGKIDYQNDLISLYLDPDLSQPEGPQTPAATRAVTFPHPTSAVRLGSGSSGANGAATWDDLTVATSWQGLNAGPVIATGDSITLNPQAKARVQVLKNDFGDLDPSTLSITSAPSHGTATISGDGTVIYESTGSLPVLDGFIYEIANFGGSATTASVSASIVSAPRFDTNYLDLPEEAPASSGFALENAFPGIAFNLPHDFATAGNSLFVTEAAGRIQLIPDVTSPSKTEFLDITDRVHNDFNEVAMKGIALHPDYATNGHLYVTYNHLDSGTYSVRVSRFTRSAGSPLTADPASEVILIDQEDIGQFHNVSVCRFGPDGYLYVGFGDGGTQEDGLDNSQHIDKNLWSCLIRIDVDKQSGNLPPNPDDDIPGSDTGTANFLIPHDNPFVDATSFNGQTIATTDVRTEIYATGLRNPWQFSFDSVSDELWLADVGRAEIEEVNVLAPGDNAGWAWREGTLPGIRTGDTINGAVEGDATLTFPVHEYGRGGAFGGSSVTGGIVYRGSRFPDLQGKYVFGDYISGNIWSLVRGTPNELELLATDGSIVSFVADPSNGDVLLLDRGDGIIHRLVETVNDSTFPPTLSETNFFADLDNLVANPGAHPYDINLRFWSDRADKSRWFLIPNDTDLVGYSRDEPWTYPEGMVWVKHFDLELTPGDPATSRRIETRFLVRNAGGAYGVTYRWNNITGGLPQTEATLVGANGEDLTLPNQVWHFPSRGECMTCHTPAGGHALSFNTRQLNMPGTLNASAGNQLDLLFSQGFLDQLPEATGELPRHLRPGESTYSLEARVRSYLDVNCAYCHRPGGAPSPSWDGRHWRTLAETGMINGIPTDAPLQPGDLLVTPGNANTSIIHNRLAAANGYSRMPPLASNIVDSEAVTLLTDWINDEANALTTYDLWREHHFGNLVSPEGEPGANPDGDNLTNHWEYLHLTDPLDDASTWRTEITVASGQVHLPIPSLPQRRVIVEHSRNLLDWGRWDVPGNEGIPLAPSTNAVLSGVAADREFFRFLIEEN